MKWFAWVIIFGSFGLFQVHSAFAWIEISGSNFGVLWSIMFELSALYFWADKQKLLGTMASIVVLAMASFNISSDARQKLETNINDKTLEVLVNTLDNIKGKDYPITIQKTMKAISDLKTDEKQQVDTPINFSSWMGIILQIVALCFVLLAQIRAILFITETKIEVVPDEVPEEVETIETETRNRPENTPEQIMALETISRLMKFGEAQGFKNETEIRKFLELPAAVFSRLRDTVEFGRGISIKKMNEIIELIERKENV